MLKLTQKTTGRKKTKRGAQIYTVYTLNHRRQHLYIEGRGQRKGQRGKRTISGQKVKSKGNDKPLVKKKQNPPMKAKKNDNHT